MRHRHTIILSILIVLSLTTIISAQTVAEWHTTLGVFRIELREDLVPLTAGNFIDLTNDGFYDGVVFHRVIDGFMIQDGDPTGTGTGGPGYTIPDEFHPELLHDGPGVLSMANTGYPDSGGSQYFITLDATDWLDAYDASGNLKNCASPDVSCHAVFGRVIEGMDVVFAIGAVETGPNDHPLVDVVISDLNILGIIYPHLDLTTTEVTEHPTQSDGDGVINPLETGQLFFALRNRPGWLDAADLTVTVTCEDERIGFVNNAINYGTIANGDSLDNSGQLIAFYTNMEESMTAILNLQITANGGSEYPYERTYEIPVEIGLTQPGWPFTLSGNTGSSALFADVDGDQIDEVIFADDNGSLHAIKIDGETEADGFPVTLSQGLSSAAALGDVNDDGVDEIVVAQGPHIYVVGSDGEIWLDYETPSSFITNPMLGDASPDGALEIIAITAAGQIYVIAADGTDVGPFPVNMGMSVMASPALADLNDDAYPEIIFANRSGAVALHAVSTLDGEEIAGWPVALDTYSPNGPVVADIDRDGWPEVVISLNDGHVAAFNHDGSEVFNRDLDTIVKAGVIAADIDRMDDDRFEIAVITSDGDLYIMDQDGNDCAGFPINVGAGVKSTPILADLNSNGSAEIIFGDDNGTLHAIDLTGAAVPGLPVNIGTTISLSPAIGNPDTDDDPEITVAASGEYFLLDFKHSGFPVWPCFKANDRRTGNLADVMTAIEDGELPDQLPMILHQNFPNPFSDFSVISFRLPASQEARLNVYNPAGQLVKTLGIGKYESGIHEVTWDGTNEQNQPVNAGVYLYRLEANGQVETRRLVLLR